MAHRDEGRGTALALQGRERDSVAGSQFFTKNIELFIFRAMIGQNRNKHDAEGVNHSLST